MPLLVVPRCALAYALWHPANCAGYIRRGWGRNLAGPAALPGILAASHGTSSGNPGMWNLTKSQGLALASQALILGSA